MSYPFRFRFVYGIGADVVDWTTSLPVRAWERRTASVGGSRTAAGGIPAAYVVRRDHILAVPVRFYESEWADVHGVIEWGQWGESLVVYPDAGGEVIAESFDVWLEFPKTPEDIRPERDPEYPRVLTQTLELRRSVDTPWPIEMFAQP